jgi:hypothetical protein
MYLSMTIAYLDVAPIINSTVALMALVILAIDVL